MKNDFHVARIGRLIVVAIPDIDWVTVIFPFSFNGTKQLSGTFDYVIRVLEKMKERSL